MSKEPLPAAIEDTLVTFAAAFVAALVALMAAGVDLGWNAIFPPLLVSIGVGINTWRVVRGVYVPPTPATDPKVSP